jgi:hypothetical protein
VEIGGIEIEVGVAAGSQGPVQAGLHLHVDTHLDPAHLGLGDPTSSAEGGHQGIDLAGGDPADIGLHHNAIERLIHAPTWLEDRREKAPRPQFGDAQIYVAGLGGEQAGPVAIALAEAVIAALLALSAEHGGHLQLD